MSNKKFYFIWLLLVLLQSFNLFAESVTNSSNISSGKVLYGALGDSITAASLADTRLINKFPFLPNPSPQKKFKNLTEFKRYLEMKALQENKDTFSWASGKSIQSNIAFLQKHHKTIGEQKVPVILNLAVPGNKAIHMAAQAKRLVNEWNTNQYLRIEYITLLIGANDACAEDSNQGTPNHLFKDQLINTFQELSKINQADPLRIYVSSIPKIPDIGRDEVLNTPVYFTNCRGVHKNIVSYCPNLIFWNSPKEYAEKVKIVRDKNQIIQDIVNETLKSFPSKFDIIYSNSFFDHNIEASDLAIDCFHPNAETQEFISRTAWNEQKWFIK
jgi:lysophospholipase L1-like esterase